MKDSLIMAKSMALECRKSIQEINMKANFKTTPSTVKVFIAGKMELDMKGTL